MAIGALWTVSLHNNGVTQILDNVEIESITDTSAVTGATVVKRITHDNGEHDAFVVQPLLILVLFQQPLLQHW
jgi:hypothetical protein